MAFLSGDFGLLGGAQTQVSKIGDLEIDAIISREPVLDSTVTQNPVEDGFPVADHVTRNPLTLSMECVFSPTPVAMFGQGADRSKLATAARELQRIYIEGEPITITTPDAIYRDMVMTHAPLTRSIENGYAYRITLDFVHVRIVRQKTEEVPEGSTSEEAEGKAGATGKDMGAAAQQDIGTGMTVIDNQPTVAFNSTTVDKSNGGNIAVGRQMVANTAVISAALCWARGGLHDKNFSL